jgi:hypothetical protein
VTRQIIKGSSDLLLSPWLAILSAVQPEALTIRLDEGLQQGVVYAPAMPERQMTIGQIATRCWTDSWKTIASVESYRPVNCPPAYDSVFLDVEVDTRTGQVRTVRAVMGSDCGTVINPDQAAGQLEGGLSKGAPNMPMNTGLGKGMGMGMGKNI